MPKDEPKFMGITASGWIDIILIIGACGMGVIFGVLLKDCPVQQDCDCLTTLNNGSIEAWWSETWEYRAVSESDTGTCEPHVWAETLIRGYEYGLEECGMTVDDVVQKNKLKPIDTEPFCAELDPEKYLIECNNDSSYCEIFYNKDGWD